MHLFLLEAWSDELAMLRPPACILVPCIARSVYHTVTDTNLVINFLHVIMFEHMHKTDNYYHTLNLGEKQNLKRMWSFLQSGLFLIEKLS